MAQGLSGVNLGRYRVLELVGQGGMASVYRAEDPRLFRQVAIKVPHAHLAADPDFSARFLREAQAVAARSYALAYTDNGSGSICATESCQVYKPANKGGKWDEAVNATRGWVLIAGGKPFSAWYASTAGGYTFSYSHNGHTTPGLWDTAKGREGWTSEAYEKIVGSPWFYKAWYRLRSGGSYGRSHPWLTETEFSDVVNALLIYKGNSGEVSHLSSLDAGISDTWSMAKVKEEAAKYGGPVGKVSSVEQVYSNDGYTKIVYLETDKGRKEFSGEDFKYMYNLRAPGAIGIKSSLFDIRRK